MIRKFSVAVVACALLGVGSAWAPHAASAASPPANDTIGGAKVVNALPFTATLDTSSATTDSDDAQVNQSCGAPLTNASVWYKFTAGAGDTVLRVDASASDYSAGIIIATGSPGNLTTIACAPQQTSAATTPGTTYYVLVFDDTTNGGTLKLVMQGPGPVPSNDRAAHAKVISSYPFTDSLDTTGATSDAKDTQANNSCGAPAVLNTVWYKLTASSAHTHLLFDASGSNYNVGFIVASGTPGNLTTIACSPFSVIADVNPGTTYYVIVFDFVGGGGNLQLTVDDAPAPPTLQLQTRPFGVADRAGNADFRYDYNCTNASFMFLQNIAIEISNKRIEAGQFIGSPNELHCDGTWHMFGIVDAPFIGHFVPGQTAVISSAQVCGAIECTDFVQSEKVVQLVNSLVSPFDARSNPRARARVTAPNARSWTRRAPRYGA